MIVSIYSSCCYYCHWSIVSLFHSCITSFSMHYYLFIYLSAFFYIRLSFFHSFFFPFISFYVSFDWFGVVFFSFFSSFVIAFISFVFSDMLFFFVLVQSRLTLFLSAHFIYIVASVTLMLVVKRFPFSSPHFFLLLLSNNTDNMYGSCVCVYVYGSIQSISRPVRQIRPLMVTDAFTICT